MIFYNTQARLAISSFIAIFISLYYSHKYHRHGLKY
jgi:hypothetical protein